MNLSICSLLSLEILSKLLTSRCNHSVVHLSIELLHHSETLSFQKSLNLLQSVSWHIGLLLIERVIKRLLLGVDHGAVLKQRLSRWDVAGGLGLSLHLLLDSLLLLLLSLRSLLIEINFLVHVHAALLTVLVDVGQVFMLSESHGVAVNLSYMHAEENKPEEEVNNYLNPTEMAMMVAPDMRWSLIVVTSISLTMVATLAMLLSSRSLFIELRLLVHVTSERSIIHR